MSDLPKGWVFSKLGDVCTPSQYGYTAKASDSGNIHYLRTTDITSGAIDWNSVPYCSVDHETREKYLLRDGDIVISRAGSVGYSHLIENPKPSVFASYLIRFKPIIDAKYFKWYLHTPAYWNAISEESLGIAVQNVNASKLSELNFPLAPNSEQTRIVAKLEELLSDLDAGVAELKVAQKKLTQYRQSLLDGVAQCTLLGAYQFEETTLGAIVTSIGQGWSPKCENHSATQPEQWAVIKTTAIQPLSFDGSHNKQLPENLKAREHLELKDGDLLVTRAGPRNRVGITCLVKSPRSRLILCDKAYRLKLNEAKVMPAYIELVLNAPRTLQTTDTLKSGINDSGLNLTQDRFFTLPVRIPTLHDQQLLVNAFEDANNEIGSFETVIQRSLTHAAAQRQNILHAAFAGQLVPQDPNDEPASMLLERIRAERATQTKPKVRGRKKVTG